MPSIELDVHYVRSVGADGIVRKILFIPCPKCNGAMDIMQGAIVDPGSSMPRLGNFVACNDCEFAQELFY